MSEMPLEVYTVGHSTHSIETFLALLKSAAITAIGDVRSHPFSRLNPQFSRNELKPALSSAGIKYVFLGKELGARSKDASCYRNGQVQYELLAKTDLFKKGIERVREGAEKYRIALMCAEKEPLDCHRTILVARTLEEQHIAVKHILATGKIESHEHAMERLISRLHIPKEDMFRSHQVALTEAYDKQASQIAYRDETEASPSPEYVGESHVQEAH
jgi:uncharacterized protein (DUF488 family)